MRAAEDEPEPELVEKMERQLEVDPESLARFIFENQRDLSRDLGSPSVHAECSWDGMDDSGRLIFMELANRIWQQLWNHSGTQGGD